MSKYLTDDQIIKHISLVNVLDVRVARLISHYPIKFLKSKMEDPYDWRPVRIRYFGVFGLTKQAKDKYTKKENDG